MRTRLVLALSVVTLGSTLAIVPKVAAQVEAPTRPQARDRDLITRDELVASAQKNQDLLKAVKSLRAHFLRPPAGVRSMTGSRPAAIQLYVDGTRQAEVESLVLIQTIDAEEVRYLEPGKAQDLYGITHNGGAIQVKMYKGPRPPPP